MVGASPGTRTYPALRLLQDLARLVGKLERIPATAALLSMVVVSEAEKI